MGVYCWTSEFEIQIPRGGGVSCSFSKMFVGGKPGEQLLARKSFKRKGLVVPALRTLCVSRFTVRVRVGLNSRSVGRRIILTTRPTTGIIASSLLVMERLEPSLVYLDNRSSLKILLKYAVALK